MGYKFVGNSTAPKFSGGGGALIGANYHRAQRDG